MPYLSDLPTLNLGHVYVIAFDNATLKVGRSRQPHVRIRDLRAKARRSGVSLTEGWYSDEHADWRLNEIRMIAFCLENFGPPASGIETYKGDYTTVLGYAQSLMSTSTP